MIPPTRTEMLRLKDRRRAVGGSVAILKGRRQALIRELLATATPLLESRQALRETYRRALQELWLSLGNEEAGELDSLLGDSRQDLGVTVEPGNILGLRYREVRATRSPVRSPPQRSYDYSQTTVHLEEAIHGFESILAEMLEQASYEGKLKRLGEELLRLTRRIRVLEERIMPEIDGHIRIISQSLGERDREAYYLLKRFKAGRRQEV